MYMCYHALTVLPRIKTKTKTPRFETVNKKTARFRESVLNLSKSQESTLALSQEWTRAAFPSQVKCKGRL